MANRTEQSTDVLEEDAFVETRAPRLVYTHAPVLLGTLLEADGDAWRVALGAVERLVDVDDSVDPALLAEAHVAGSRVLVDSAHPPTIVGVVQTQRALTIDRDGDVNAEIRELRLNASESFLIGAPGAFVRAKAREVEVYGDRVLTRARNLARILSAMIKLN